MLKTQAYLREHGVSRLVEEFGIKVVRHPTDPLLILNYCQIKSPRKHEISDECRSLVLEDGSFDLVARGFSRFYNVGEFPDSPFDWSKYTAYSKEDGSLMVLYQYKGRWRVNTRGSFADQPMVTGGPTWEEVFWSFIKETKRDVLRGIEPDSLVFEMCTPYNVIVSRYAEPRLFLLSAFEGVYESERCYVDEIARRLGVERPYNRPMTGRDELDKAVDNLEGLHQKPEGFVLRDDRGFRLKMKTKTYQALHALKDNGALLLPKNILPIVMRNEHHETVAIFPEYKTAFEIVAKRYERFLSEVELLWEKSKDAVSQKDFALQVKDHALSGLLFAKRRNPEVSLSELAIGSEKYIADHLFFGEVFSPDVVGVAVGVFDGEAQEVRRSTSSGERAASREGESLFSDRRVGFVQERGREEMDEVPYHGVGHASQERREDFDGELRT